MNALEVGGIRKPFLDVLALDDVTFTVAAGEAQALVGEDGAGASTLMRILGGACPRDAGAIRLNGRPVETADPHHARSLGVSVIYQEVKLAADRDVV